MHDDEQAAHRSSTGWADLADRPADPVSLTELATAVPGSLNGAQLVDAIVASEKALSLLTGIQTRLLAAFAVPFTAGDPMKLANRLARKNRDGDPSDEDVQMLVADAAVSLAGAEVAAALRVSPVTAGIRVRDAQTMTTKLAPTLDALEQGRLDRGKVRVIAENCDPLTDEHAAQVQELVLPGAGELTTSELRDITGQAVITVDPDGAENRHQAAAARRELSLKALPDAMATLKAFLPADGAVKIFQISDLLATSTAGTPDDPRGIGARRVDALVDIADHLLTHGYLDLSSFMGKPLPDADDPDPSRDPDPRPATNTPTEPSANADPSIPADPADPADPVRAAGPADSANAAETNPNAPDAAMDPAHPDTTDDTGACDPIARGDTTDPTDPGTNAWEADPADPSTPAESPTPAVGHDPTAGEATDADSAISTSDAAAPAPKEPAEPVGPTVASGNDNRPGQARRSDRARRTLTRHARTSRSPSDSAPSPDWTTCPAPWPGSAPSRPVSPAASRQPPRPSPHN